MNCIRPRLLFPAIVFLLICRIPSLQADAPEIGGQVKTLNFLTQTSGLSPESPVSLIPLEKNERVFNSLERVRLKVLTKNQLSANQRLLVQVHYDHQPQFGTFVSTGDFRMAHRQSEQRQFLDLSQTLVEKNNVFYEHRFYRANVTYENSFGQVKIGRQQIPWGVGRFFTPTDIFNPFNPLQIELMERDGVDAVNLILKKIHGYKSQFIYTPDGKELHPQRYFARFSKDIKGFEVGVLGGRIKRDEAAGFDFAGNIRDAAFRGEGLFRAVDGGRKFAKFTINADYNLPKNIYALVEYHFNGEGKRSSKNYDMPRFIRGDIQQLAKNYLALSLGHDLTSLCRLENRLIWNLDDNSLFIRPQMEYELKTNLFLLLGAQLYAGDKTDELGSPKNLYFLESRYDF